MIPSDRELRTNPIMNVLSPIFGAAPVNRIDSPVSHFLVIDINSPIFVRPLNPSPQQNGFVA